MVSSCGYVCTRPGTDSWHQGTAGYTGHCPHQGAPWGHSHICNPLISACHPIIRAHERGAAERQREAILWGISSAKWILVVIIMKNDHNCQQKYSICATQPRLLRQVIGSADRNIFTFVAQILSRPIARSMGAGRSKDLR